MSGREKELTDFLTVACGLLQVESRDHKEGHMPTRDQRRNIAKTLDEFCAKARNCLKQQEAA